MRLSLVIPVYFNEGNIPVTWTALETTLASLPEDIDWEVVFVDDGSQDGSYAKLLETHTRAPERVKLVKLTRNFGQVPAILAGLKQASGDCCIVMSADLQDPPSLILKMLERWERGDNKIVLATRKNREDGYLAKLTSRAFYRLMRRYAIPNMPEGGFDFFLIDRQVVDQINNGEEKNSFIQGQILWTGYTPEIIPYTRIKREIGESRWTLSKKLKYFVDGFVSYSGAPLRLITVTGLAASLLSFGYSALIIALKLFWGLPVEGWAPIMVTVLMLGGIQLVMIGVLGEYLWRNLDETRKRPIYVIESVVDDSPRSVDDPGAR